MSTSRKFDFPLATLPRSAELLRSALTDPDHQAATTARLGADFTNTFPKKIATVTGGASAKSGQTGNLPQLTTARVQYPGTTDPTGNAKNITQRARFLLNEFAPRDRDQSEDTPQASDAPPPTACENASILGEHTQPFVPFFVYPII